MSNDGGPAFPSGPEKWRVSADGKTIEPIGHHGMSLRDWFAGQALAGLLSHMGGPYIEDMANGVKGGALESAAAYAWADAMIAERNK